MSFAFRGFMWDREAAGLASGSLMFYEQKLKPFLVFLDSQGISRIADVTTDHVRCFIMLQRERGLEPGGVHAFGRAAKAFLRWAADEDLLDARVPAKIKLPRVPKKVIQPFSLDQVNAMLKAAGQSNQPERDVAILLVLFDTGIRVSELAGLRDQDMEGDRLLVMGKGSRERWVRVSAKTRRAIWAWLKVRGEASPWLFVSRTGAKLTPNTVEQLFDRLEAVAGVKGVRCSPHTARHTTGVEWIRSGGDAFELQKMLGHTTLHMTNRYVALASEDVARAHARHSLVDRLTKNGKRR